ncbi:MAG: hypothetical protein CM15mP85_31630 [Rhodobacterales bacterium]|nr:MAG: hypothetical protein CM15mP85_31630 [Rhodobacterales bacterium]
MEFVWGRYSGLFYTGTGGLLFVGLGILFSSFWFFLAAGLIFLFSCWAKRLCTEKKSCSWKFSIDG